MSVRAIGPRSVSTTPRIGSATPTASRMAAAVRSTASANPSLDRVRGSGDAGWMRLTALACLAACNGPSDDGESADTGGTPEPYEPTWAGMERLFADNCDR